MLNEIHRLKPEFSTNWPLDSTLRSHFAIDKCTTLLCKLAIWPTKDQILQTSGYFKEGDMAGR